MKVTHCHSYETRQEGRRKEEGSGGREKTKTSLARIDFEFCLAQGCSLDDRAERFYNSVVRPELSFGLQQGGFSSGGKSQRDFSGKLHQLDLPNLARAFRLEPSSGLELRL